MLDGPVKHAELFPELACWPKFDERSEWLPTFPVTEDDESTSCVNSKPLVNGDVTVSCTKPFLSSYLQINLRRVSFRNQISCNRSYSFA